MRMGALADALSGRRDKEKGGGEGGRTAERDHGTGKYRWDQTGQLYKGSRNYHEAYQGCAREERTADNRLLFRCPLQCPLYPGLNADTWVAGRGVFWHWVQLIEVFSRATTFKTSIFTGPLLPAALLLFHHSRDIRSLTGLRHVPCWMEERSDCTLLHEAGSSPPRLFILLLSSASDGTSNLSIYLSRLP